MSIQLDARYNQPERQNAFFRGLIDRASALPGVEAAAAINYLPLGGGESMGTGLVVEGHPFDEKTLFEGRSITPRYFAAMGIPLLGGRVFTDDDVSGRPPVAIVSRSFARSTFPARMPWGSGAAMVTQCWLTIVGVVGDVRQWSLEATPPMQIYRPLWQTGANSVSVVARTSLAPDRLASDMRAAGARSRPGGSAGRCAHHEPVGFRGHRGAPFSDASADGVWRRGALVVAGGLVRIDGLFGAAENRRDWDSYGVGSAAEQRNAPGLETGLCTRAHRHCTGVCLRLGFDAMDGQPALRGQANRCARLSSERRFYSAR
jgi:hypothetical protein